MKRELILLLILLLMITVSCTTEEESDPVPGFDGAAGADSDSVVNDPDGDTVKNETEPTKAPDTDLTCNPGDAIRCSDTEIKDLIKCNSEGTGEVVTGVTVGYPSSRSIAFEKVISVPASFATIRR